MNNKQALMTDDNYYCLSGLFDYRAKMVWRIIVMEEVMTIVWKLHIGGVHSHARIPRISSGPAHCPFVHTSHTMNRADFRDNGHEFVMQNRTICHFTAQIYHDSWMNEWMNDGQYDIHNSPQYSLPLHSDKQNAIFPCFHDGGCDTSRYYVWYDSKQSHPLSIILCSHILNGLDHTLLLHTTLTA